MMNNEIIVRFADVVMGLSSRSPFLERFCKDYLSSGKPSFSVFATDEQIENEIKATPEPTTNDYAEALCIYREIAEKLPLFNRFVFHGAAIEYGGKAYIFTAPSGTGKTTHISLWRQYLGEDVHIINGDKPIIAVDDDVTVYGTPYAGKEGWQTNSSAPLGGICFILRGKHNEIALVPPKDAFTRLFLQTYKPYDRQAMEKTLALVRKMCTVPCYALSCDMSEGAVKTSFEALTKSEFEEKKL